jgi:hypothetical protein
VITCIVEYKSDHTHPAQVSAEHMQLRSCEGNYHGHLYRRKDNHFHL